MTIERILTYLGIHLQVLTIFILTYYSRSLKGLTVSIGKSNKKIWTPFYVGVVEVFSCHYTLSSSVHRVAIAQPLVSAKTCFI